MTGRNIGQTRAQLGEFSLATDETTGRGSTRGRHGGRILLQRY
jgi:hypothetical protein